MTYSWALNIALEMGCLWLLARTGRLRVLQFFLVYMLAFDVTAIPARALMGSGFSYFYWAGMSLTYLLQVWVCKPWKTLPHYTFLRAYWIITFAMVGASVGWTWMFKRQAQFDLGVAAGLMCLFIAVAVLITTPRILPAATWVGVVMWAVAGVACNLAGGYLNTEIPILYPSVCAVALVCFMGTALTKPSPKRVLIEQMVPTRGRNTDSTLRIHAV